MASDEVSEEEEADPDVDLEEATVEAIQEEEEMVEEVILEEEASINMSLKRLMDQSS